MYQLSPEIERYIEEMSSSLPGFLEELERATYWETPYPQMLSGPIQAGILRFLVALVQPAKILEIGTFTGYATLAMASALPEGGRILTIDNNPENLHIFRRFLPECKNRSAIEIIEEDAVSFLQRTDQKFDFVFLDADKENYPEYYRLIKPLLNPDGLWITDNVLWSGKVLDPKDEQSRAIARFNRMVREDPDLLAQILPIRDGLLLIRRQKGKNKE